MQRYMISDMKVHDSTVMYLYTVENIFGSRQLLKKRFRFLQQAYLTKYRESARFSLLKPEINPNDSVGHKIN